MAILSNRQPQKLISLETSVKPWASGNQILPWKEFKYVLDANNAQDIIRSIVDGLSSLLDGNGYIDNLGIAEATEFNFFKDDDKK